MSGKFQPALLAGGALGVVLIIIAVVTALVPPLGLLGCCACLLPIGAGLFAVSQYVGKSAAPVQLADGAILGAIAGAVGGIIYLIIGMPVAYMINAAAISAQMDQMRQAGIDIPIAGFALALVGGIIGVIVDVLLGLIGGLIGVAIFEKRKGGAGAPPPPPPPAGGYGGGGAAGGYPGGGGGGSYGQGV
ncbi:MAG: hypothetical protein QOD42_1579 [Sphingomonadales bacterium]|jgi:hypothetical protein|nr:hypothetical protein [Sphingomonadales bacterium]